MFTVEHTLQCKGKPPHPQAILSPSNILTKGRHNLRAQQSPLAPVRIGTGTRGPRYICYFTKSGDTSQGARGVAPPPGQPLTRTASSSQTEAKSSCRSHRRTGPPPQHCYPCRHSQSHQSRPPEGSKTQHGESPPTPDVAPAPASSRAAHH